MDRTRAWGYLMTNVLVLPGLGSIAAGRRSGYVQAILALVGLVLSAWFVTVAAWALIAHRVNLVEAAGNGRIFSELDDVAPTWKFHLALGAAGLGVFLTGWCWALLTSLSLLRSVSLAPPPPLLRS